MKDEWLLNRVERRKFVSFQENGLANSHGRVENGCIGWILT
jgi:hypothetical protein